MKVSLFNLNKLIICFSGNSTSYRLDLTISNKSLVLITIINISSLNLNLTLIIFVSMVNSFKNISIDIPLIFSIIISEGVIISFI